MMANLKLTVTGGGKSITVGVDPAKIIGLAAAPSGGTAITIPTRTFVVAQSLDAVLLAWVGPNAGDHDEPKSSAPVAGERQAK